jgi:hypothetical protein
MRVPFLDKSTDNSETGKITYLEKLYDAADGMRKKFESEWYTNCLFLAGQQWEKAAEDVRRFRKLPIQSSQTKVKLVSNQILALSRQAVSSINEHLAEQVAIAATSEQADVDAAELSTDFLRARYYDDNEETVRRNEILWTMCCGRVLRKTFWDPDLDGEGIGGKIVKAGDISTITLNPFQFHVCPWSSSGDDIPWIIESDVRDISEINDLYPGKDIEAEEVADASRFMDKLLSNVVEGTEQGATKKENAVILKRLYCRPDAKNPKGKYYVWANNVLLQEGTLPEGQMPFTAIDWFPIPGRAYPLPFVTPLRDLQREINITMSQIVELKNRQLRGDLVLRGVGDVHQEIDPITGAKRIKVDPGIQQFEFMRYDLNPTEAEVLLDRLHGDAMRVAGIHDPTMGNPSSSRTTATEIAMLKESDMSGLTLFRAGFDNSYSKVAILKLLNAKNHYHIPRLIKVVGEGNEVRTAAFMGSDLRNTQDVRPRPAPLLTETMKSQMRMVAYGQGLYGPYMSLPDKYAKLTALLNSGLPDAEQEVRERLGNMTMSDLRQMCNQFEMMQAQAQMMAMQTQMQQMAMSMPQQQQQVPVDQNGQPLDDGSEIQALMASGQGIQ